MNPVPFHPSPNAAAAAPAPALPPPWFPMLPPNAPPSASFWNTKNVRDRMAELQDTLSLAKAMQNELELLQRLKENEGYMKNGEMGSVEHDADEFLKYLEHRKTALEKQELRSVDAANALMSKLRAQLEPFRFVVDEAAPWEEKSAAVRLMDKVRKSKRNKLWRKRKRRRVAEMRAKEHEKFEQADREADEWRAREMAKDAAQLKMEKMKEIAKLKAKEERKRLESELELVLIVERLQELRSMRIQKLKKQGHFLPEEDDKFLERVRAAVEEEERQVVAAADTDAAKDAIVTAEESRKSVQSHGPKLKDPSNDNGGLKESKDHISESKGEKGSGEGTGPSEEKGSESRSYGGAYNSLINLPSEFYHYYYGSNNDMGTLIEVRRTWDAYIRPGGSRIPGHWVQPPPPADDIWASYLIRPRQY